MDSHTFTTQIEAQRAPLLRLARHLVRQEVDAGILLQDTLTRAYTYRHTFRRNVNLLNWLKTVMRNLHYSRSRRDQRRRRLMEGFRSIPRQSYNEGEYMLLRQEADRVLATFADPFRLAFDLRLKGHSYQEIADALSVPIGTIKSRIFVVRKEMRRHFA